MYLGSLVEEAPSDTLYAEPKRPVREALMSAVPVPDPEVEDRRERILLTGDLPSPANPPSGCRFHTRCPGRRPRSARPNGRGLKDVGGGHRVACHYVAEIASGELKPTRPTGIEAVTETEDVLAERAEGEAEVPPRSCRPTRRPSRTPRWSRRRCRQRSRSRRPDGRCRREGPRRRGDGRVRQGSGRDRLTDRRTPRTPEHRTELNRPVLRELLGPRIQCHPSPCFARRGVLF
ncbi:hypothetical protein SHIRM173S_03802 [Streptomyces hirsutus]